MIKVFKSLFSKKKEKEYIPDPPGRTFKRVDTGRYFGCEDKNATVDRVIRAKQKKIDQITELGLVPMFTRYTYKDTNKNIRENQAEETHPDLEVSSVYVVFQKEILAEKWNMTHVTEISFTIEYSDFDEFEKMSGVSLDTDFRDLTSKENSTPYNGKERRKKYREAHSRSE